MLDTRLTGEEQEEFFAFVETHKLTEAVQTLWGTYEIKLSEQAISNWAARVRKERANLQFHQLLAEIDDDAQRAEEFGERIGALRIAGITQANVAMLSQALFRAQRDKQPASVEFFTNLLATLLGSVAKHQTGQASVIAAEVSRDRFQFDAAKKIDAHLDSLVAIKRDVNNERERYERIIETVFGRRPANSSSFTHAGSVDDGTQASADPDYIGSNTGDIETAAAASGTLAKVLDKGVSDV